MNWTDIFSAGLIGSLLTLVITKSFDLLDKSKSNQFQLRKTYFERMLITAETTVGQMSFLSQSLLGMSSMFRGLMKQETKIGSQYNETVINDYNKKITEYASKIEHLTQPILLYFDVESLLYRQSIFTEFQAVMDELGRRSAIFQEANSKYEADPSNPLLDKAFDDAFQKVGEQLGVIADALERMALDLKKVIEKITIEMAIYKLRR